MLLVLSKGVYRVSVIEPLLEALSAVYDILKCNIPGVVSTEGFVKRTEAPLSRARVSVFEVNFEHLVQQDLIVIINFISPL